jgi:uncharacterized heparinase superfamily protein
MEQIAHQMRYNKTMVAKIDDQKEVLVTRIRVAGDRYQHEPNKNVLRKADRRVQNLQTP